MIVEEQKSFREERKFLEVKSCQLGEEETKIQQLKKNIEFKKIRVDGLQKRGLENSKRSHLEDKEGRY